MNLTMRQLAPPFAVSKSGEDRIINSLGPMLAPQPANGHMCLGRLSKPDRKEALRQTAERRQDVFAERAPSRPPTRGGGSSVDSARSDSPAARWQEAEARQNANPCGEERSQFGGPPPSECLTLSPCHNRPEPQGQPPLTPNGCRRALGQRLRSASPAPPTP